MTAHAAVQRAGCLAVALFSFPCAAATVSGVVEIPASDGGYQFELSSSNPCKVRVEGTSISADVIPSSRTAGTFALTGVPDGPVALLLVEPDGSAGGVPYDVFTMRSKRLRLDVAGDLSGAAFALEYHWKKLPSYPPPWRDARYDIWQPYFVSDQVGFLSFLGRGFDPFVHELWRTTDGGASWQRIGEWVYGTASAIPDFRSSKDIMFFDADHGVMTANGGIPPGPYSRYYPVGLLRTADGGATWSYVDLPNVPAGSDPGTEPAANGFVSLQAHAAIDATRWISCGSENVGSYMGSGSPAYVTIWETDDAGATWRIAHHWREDYGACSALQANAAGRAILFDTPYAFGGTRRLVLRDPSGAWTERAGQDLVTNSGYGPADVPMVGDTAWVRAQSATTQANGVWRSDDAGSTWSQISSSLPQYMAFGSLRKGFAPAGGPVYATYDGGVTWKYQAQGGGICCHGNHIFAFDTTHAIWQDGGVGDPNRLSDIFTYVEPWEADLEVLPATTIADAALEASAVPRAVPVLSFRLESHGPVPLRLAGLSLRASGTGDDRADVRAVRLWWDRNANGALDADDVELASGAFAADDGRTALVPASGPLLHPFDPLAYLVTLDFAPVRNLRTYSVSLAAADVGAEADGAAVSVAATAPTGTALTGATITLRAYADLQASLADAPDPALEVDPLTYTATVRNNGPDDAAGVQLVDTLPAGAALVSAAASQGSCAAAGGTVTCPLGRLASGGAATVAVVVRPAGPGTLTSGVRVSATEIDRVPGNDAATATTAVGPAADLRVSLVASPDPVTAGQPLTYAATVVNDGPSAATGASLGITLPAGATFVSASASQGTCAHSAASGSVTCALHDLGVGASATVAVVVTPGAAGALTARALASSAAPDHHAADDLAVVTDTAVEPLATSKKGGCGCGSPDPGGLLGAALLLAALRRRTGGRPARDAVTTRR